VLQHPPPFRLVLVSADALHARRFAAALSEDDRIDLVGIAYTAREAAALVSTLDPDAVVIAHLPPHLDAFTASLEIGTRARGHVLVIADEARAAVSPTLGGSRISCFLQEAPIRQLSRMMGAVVALTVALSPSSSATSPAP
jgi:AmiR/NasT family two-component response regulator